MANLPAGGLRSLGSHLGSLSANNDVIVEEFTRVKEMKLIPIEEPLMPPEEEQPRATLLDVPILPGTHNCKTTKHLLDVVREWSGTFSKVAVKECVCVRARTMICPSRSSPKQR